LECWTLILNALPTTQSTRHCHRHYRVDVHRPLSRALPTIDSTITAHYPALWTGTTSIQLVGTLQSSRFGELGVHTFQGSSLPQIHPACRRIIDPKNRAGPRGLARGWRGDGAGPRGLVRGWRGARKLRAGTRGFARVFGATLPRAIRHGAGPRGAARGRAGPRGDGAGHVKSARGRVKWRGILARGSAGFWRGAARGT
jgi:hypothetical protein